MSTGLTGVNVRVCLRVRRKCVHSIEIYAQPHAHTLIVICAPYFPASLCTHPLSHPLFILSSLLRSPSSLAQQQPVVCSTHLRSSLSLSLHCQPQQSPHRSYRDWFSPDPYMHVCVCLGCWLNIRVCTREVICMRLCCV